MARSWPSPASLPLVAAIDTVPALFFDACLRFSRQTCRGPVFTPHQDAALKAVAGWLKQKPGKRGTPQIFRLFGYAGTGKTTLAKHIAAVAEGNAPVAAFTIEAAPVLRSKSCFLATTI